MKRQTWQSSETQRGVAIKQVITVDTTWLGRILNELKNRFHLPGHLGFSNYPWINRNEMEDGTDRSSFDTTLTWEKKKYFESKTSLPIWLKGILAPENAILAVEAGADGIIASNHGGTQMDETLSTLDALPDIVAAGRVEISFTSMEVSEKEVKFSKPWVPTTVVLVVFLYIGPQYLAKVGLDGSVKRLKVTAKF
ncbi:hypothetical protein CA3LBN_004820 [Candidozyma haemuli]|uniref:FMN hydroxy acid dehydrogenase domain-containing protein n=1 Tax=Candidozyma haemuli TaxID=45357 RepID=A0ABX8ID78_9ASCO|nr:hypothetical protein CA3LBN_004820 [[Candida] haemuloni]